MLNDLKLDNGFWYLGSPYSKYPDGIEEAARRISEIAGALIRLGIPVYSPIAHTHPIAIASGMDPLDHEIWLPADEPLARAAHGLLLAQMRSWDTSYGLSEEQKIFRDDGKPVVFIDPRDLDIEP